MWPSPRAVSVRPLRQPRQPRARAPSFWAAAARLCGAAAGRVAALGSRPFYCAPRCAIFCARSCPFRPLAVTIKVAARTVEVKGPRGSLTRAFKGVNFAANLLSPTLMRVDMWFGNRQEIACLRTT